MKYILIVFTAALLIGCGNTERNEIPDEQQLQFDTTDIKTEPVTENISSFLLRYKFKKGDQLKYRYTSIADGIQRIEADTSFEQISKQTVTYLVNLTINSVDADSVIELSVNIPRIKAEVIAEGIKMDYDSGVERDSLTKVQFAEYESVANNPFEVRIAKTGELIEIFKVDRLVNAFLKLRGAPENISADDKMMVRQQIIEGALKPIVVQLFRQLPGHYVAKDSTWVLPTTRSRLLVFDLENTSSYTIENIEKYQNDLVAVFSGSIRTSITGPQNVSEGGINYEFEMPRTSASGTIYFNVDKGLVQKSRTQTVIEAKYFMEVPTPAGKEKGSRKDKITTTNIVERL